MIKLSRFALQTLPFFLFSLLVHAAEYNTPLTVIGDHGGERFEMVLSKIIGPTREEVSESLIRENILGANGAFTSEAMKRKLTIPFPLVSKAVPGRFVAKDFQRKRSEINRPIAIVGDDALSRQWIKAYSEKLKEIGAYVVIVSSVSKESAAVVAKIYGAEVAVMNVDSFLERYGVSRIPALLTSDGLYQ